MQVSEPKHTFDLLSETSSALRTEKALLTVMTQPEKKKCLFGDYILLTIKTHGNQFLCHVFLTLLEISCVEEGLTETINLTCCKAERGQNFMC